MRLDYPDAITGCGVVYAIVLLLATERALHGFACNDSFGGSREMLDRAAHCELSFSPNLNLISTVRRFVAEFYERILGDPQLTSRLVVSTHELLENAVRYSVDGQSAIRISVAPVSPTDVEVSIETRNRSTPESIATLSALVAEMNAAQERDDFYQSLLRRSAVRDDGSGLGLGRIFAEAELDVTCDFEEELVRMRAVGRFPLRETKETRG